MLPVMSGKELVAFLEHIGFSTIRQRGSYVRMKSDDGRYTTIPVHAGEDLPKGLIRKIIRDDLEMTLRNSLKRSENTKINLTATVPA
ncbi:MAG: type II toxin-antitoxin system HicA family toxin [Methanoregula sp.]|jgi:predicted RNA binding protein YcfA (HicA-like mRNA interferase family)|uniref:type II toxin-antitoxin system HicA family toxin n=1 Tax=Methanoregula sp. TaxID=2052170 RepID=UPI003C243CBF